MTKWGNQAPGGGPGPPGGLIPTGTIWILGDPRPVRKRPEQRGMARGARGRRPKPDPEFIV